jgi:hypothetical protein
MAVAFNTRGVHTSIIYLQHIINNPIKPIMLYISRRNKTQPHQVHMEGDPKRPQTPTYIPKTGHSYQPPIGWYNPSIKEGHIETSKPHTDTHTPQRPHYCSNTHTSHIIFDNTQLNIHAATTHKRQHDPIQLNTRLDHKQDHICKPHNNNSHGRRPTSHPMRARQNVTLPTTHHVLHRIGPATHDHSHDNPRLHTNTHHNKPIAFDSTNPD